MKKLLAILGAIIIGVAAAATAKADYYVYESTSIGLDSTWCYNRSYVGFAYDHAEFLAPGQTMPRVHVIGNDGGYLYLNAVWLPTGNTVTFFNGLFFQTVGPYECYVLIFFQSDGIHIGKNPKTFNGLWWLPCEDFGTWELTPIGNRSYDPNRLPDP